MAAQYKTRCPHCHAQFRIGEQHLRQAKGQVRCGSCLKVFLATENLVQKPAQPAAADRDSSGAAPASKWDMPADAAESTPDTRWTLNEEDGASGKAPPDSSRTSKSNTVDGDDASNDTRVSLGGLELSDTFLSLDGDRDDERLRNDDFSDMAGVASGGSSAGTDESWAEQLLEELDEKPNAPPQHADAMTLSESEEEQREREARAARQARKREKTTQATQAQDDWMDDIHAPDPFGAGSDDLLSSFPDDDATTLDIDTDNASRSGLWETVRWTAASLALLLVLAAQYLAFEFEDLARNPTLRPFYSALCDRLPCELPPLTDIAALRASNLVVRPHPTADGALMVDLLLHNRGPHAQPYPDLELGFTSLEGSAVASRRFTPDEYLQGDVAPGDLMPVDRPIHVSLEILDPGTRAVNYVLRPLPPTTGQG